MNSSNNRSSFLDKFRDHLPAVLYTEVPMPAFLTTPIHIPGLGKSSGSTAKHPSKNTKKNTNTNASKFFLEGIINPGRSCRFSIAEKDFDINAETWIIGNIEYGATARVKGLHEGEKRIAGQIVILRGPKKN